MASTTISFSKRKLICQMVGIGVVMSALFILSRVYPLTAVIDWLQVRMNDYQPWSTMAYPFVFALCNLCLLPGSALVIASGFFFGTLQGFFLVWVGHLLSVTVAFVGMRWVGRNWVKRRLNSKGWWNGFEQISGHQTVGWKLVFLSQLNPLAPTSLLNYLYGVTNLPLRACLIGVALGQAPGLLLYSYLGHWGKLNWKLEGAHEVTAALPVYAQLLLWSGALMGSLLLTYLLSRLITQQWQKYVVPVPASPLFNSHVDSALQSDRL